MGSSTKFATVVDRNPVSNWRNDRPINIPSLLRKLAGGVALVVACSIVFTNNHEKWAGIANIRFDPWYRVPSSTASNLRSGHDVHEMEGRKLLSFAIAHDPKTIHEKIELFDQCGFPQHRIDSGELNSRYCSWEHHEAIVACSLPNANMVLKPPDEPEPLEVIQPYSLIPGVRDPAGTRSSFELPPLPRCKTAKELIDAVGKGSRIWPSWIEGEGEIGREVQPPIFSADREQVPSRFSPYKCRAPSLPPSPERTCEILNLYSHVIIVGDSLTRHLRTAIYSAMRGNWYEGAVVTENAETREKCRCDGQYSEHPLCRTFDDYFTKPSKPTGGGMCSNLPLGDTTDDESGNDSFVITGVDQMHTKWGIPNNVISWEDKDCNNPNNRGILYFMQGGLHFRSDSAEYVQEIMDPLLSNPAFRRCVETGKLRMIWSGITSQSRHMDDIYPWQSRENTKKFNDEVIEFLRVRAEKEKIMNYIYLLDWHALTQDSMPNGIHQLSDVNLAKAAHFLELAQLIK